MRGDWTWNWPTILTVVAGAATAGLGGYVALTVGLATLTTRVNDIESAHKATDAEVQRRVSRLEGQYEAVEAAEGAYRERLERELGNIETLLAATREDVAAIRQAQQKHAALVMP